jgi:PAS domain S-box-containing protein
MKANGRKMDFIDATTINSLVYKSPEISDKERITTLLNTIRGFEEFTLDLSGKILSSNLELVNITGYEESEVIGRSFSIFYTEDDRLKGQPYRDLFEVLKSGRIFRTGWRVKKKGVSFWAKVLITALKEDKGAVSGFRIAMKDATQYVVFSYRTKRLRDEYMHLFNNPFMGVIKFVTSNFKIVLSNAMANKLLHINPNKEIFFGEVFQRPEDFSLFTELLETNGYVKDFEFQVCNSNTWLSINCICFTGNATTEGILQDVTQTKNQKIELNRLHMEIDKFIYHSSHDLRAPLTTILGITNLILLQTKEIEVLKYNNLIKEQASHLDALLKVLVSISFNNEGNVNCMLINFSDELNAIIQKHENEEPLITTTISIQAGCSFYSDNVRLRIILENLISNACKYSDPSKKQYIKIHVDVDVEQCTIEVEDNGIGIENINRGKIFNLFFKTDKKGFGLGLYIVKSSVDFLKGKIEFESTYGVGTLFKITLPNMRYLSDSSPLQ